MMLHNTRISIGFVGKVKYQRYKYVEIYYLDIASTRNYKNPSPCWEAELANPFC